MGHVAIHSIGRDKLRLKLFSRPGDEGRQREHLVDQLSRIQMTNDTLCWCMFLHACALRVTGRHNVCSKCTNGHKWYKRPDGIQNSFMNSDDDHQANRSPNILLNIAWQIEVIDGRQLEDVEETGKESHSRRDGGTNCMTLFERCLLCHSHLTRSVINFESRRILNGNGPMIAMVSHTFVKDWALKFLRWL